MTRNHRKMWAGVRVILLAAGALLAQEASPGDKALQAKDWTAAERYFQDAVKQDPNNGHAWFQLGMAYESDSKSRDAIDAFDHAAKLNEQGYRALYHKALAQSQSGEKDGAFATFAELNKQGFVNENALQSDARLEPLRSDSRWAAVVAATHENATPCEHRAENRQFDFWIGEWDVQTTTGQPAGTSKIERILNGCALLENWSGGGPGKSLNIYNTVRKQWQQFWVDAGGEVHEYAGNLVDGEMHFEGPAADHDGGKTMRRMTFQRLDGGRVRQTGYMSKDGKEFEKEYELIYVPKSSSAKN